MSNFFQRVILTLRVCQTDLVLAFDEGLLVDMHMQNYQSLCAAVMICSTLVNIHTHKQHFDQLI